MATQIPPSSAATQLAPHKTDQGQRSYDKATLIVLTILGIASFASLVVGFASFGHAQGWWRTLGAMSHISQVDASGMMIAGGEGALFCFMISCVCSSRKEGGDLNAQGERQRTYVPPRTVPPLSTPPSKGAVKSTPVSSGPTQSGGVDRLSARIGSEKWQQVGDVGIEPPVPDHLQALFDPEVHHLLLIPATVDGCPVGINFLQHRGVEIPYELFTEYQNYKIQQSYWVILTKEHVPESCNKDKSDQLEIVSQAGYQAPRFFEAVIFDLFFQNLFYTRCEEVDTVVGHSESTELRIMKGNNPQLGMIGAHR